MSSISWDGAKITDSLNRMQSNGLSQAVEATLLKIAEQAIEIAKSIVPVDTGRLRDSIRILEQGQNYVVIGSDVEYAIAIEFGTYKMAAQPYLGPAGDAVVSQFQEVFAPEFNTLLQ